MNFFYYVLIPFNHLELLTPGQTGHCFTVRSTGQNLLSPQLSLLLLFAFPTCPVHTVLPYLIYFGIIVYSSSGISEDQLVY